MTGSAGGGTIGDAAARASAWLVEQRDADGLFGDFATYAGTSDEWITAYVCEAVLSAEPSPGAHAAAQDAVRRLAPRQRADGGWGYNEAVPSDCDSTAWAVAALCAAGASAPSRLAACRFLARQQRADGAFATYGSAEPIARFIGFPATERLRGWTSGHACVSGAAVVALARALPRGERGPVAAGAAWLRAAQQPDGRWRAYWWPGWPYATLHALQALAAAGQLGEDAARRASDLALGAGADDGGFGPDRGAAPDAFSTALALRVLLAGPSPRHRRRARDAARWLVERQAPEGAWASAAVLRIPEPSVLAPWALEGSAFPGIEARDQHGIFTTATALRALAAARALAP